MLRSLNLSRMAQSFEEVAVHAVRNGARMRRICTNWRAWNVSTARNGGWSGACASRACRWRRPSARCSWRASGRCWRSSSSGCGAARLWHEAVNVVAVGRPGTGKSHAMAALGHELIAQGHTVYWSSTAALVQRLLAAKRDLCLPRELAKLDRFACLILDDIGYVQHDRDEMEVLFTLLAERYERKSVVITTNLVFSEWNRIFKDPMTTMAAIDRVVHHSVILDMMGLESYRAKEASAQQTAARTAGGPGHRPLPQRKVLIDVRCQDLLSLDSNMPSRATGGTWTRWCATTIAPPIP